MKPLIHALSSAKRFGGHFIDHLPVHEFMDSSKAILSDNRHRALLHNDWGVATAIKAFGEGAGKLAEQHCQEDLRFIPTLQDWHEHVDQSKARMRTRGNASRDIDGGVLRTALEFAGAYVNRNLGRQNFTPDGDGAVRMILPILQFLDHGRDLAGGDPGHSLSVATLNSFTIIVAERIFGSYLMLPEDKIPISTREIGERLAINRWKKVPSAIQFILAMSTAPWMSAGCAACRCACRHSKGQSAATDNQTG
jgi:hypothetical protein